MKYQKQIENYDKLEGKCRTQQSEIDELKKQLERVSNERDRLKITLETLTEYSK